MNPNTFNKCVLTNRALGASVKYVKPMVPLLIQDEASHGHLVVFRGFVEIKV